MLRTTLLAAAVLVACSSTPDAGSSADAVDAHGMWQRPVLVRVWQNESRTAGTLTAAEVAQRIQDAGAIGGPNSPTIVSGVLRLARDTNITWDMIGDWLALRGAFPDAAFDVALNMCDYGSASAAIDKMSALDGVFAAWEQAFPGNHFRPEAWFFDFYDRPFAKASDCQTNQDPKAMFQEIAQWVHGKSNGKPRQLVGGNVWSIVPPGADFVAVPDEQGVQHTLDKARAFGNDVMRVVHVENNPQKCADDDPQHPTSDACRNNGGDKLIWRTTPNERLAYHHAFRAAETPTLRYMTPVLFPLSQHLGASGTNAFDAVTNEPASSLPKH